MIETRLTSNAQPEMVDVLKEPVYAPYRRVRDLVRPGTRVLDVGCGNGKVGAYLTEAGAVVDGVEPSDSRAAVARTRLNYVTQDLLSADKSDPSLSNSYDLILFLDVIEHLAEPGPVLELAASRLAPSGAICALIPNSAHITFRAKIARGDWTYTPGGGLFDQTHLRFFDTRTVGNLAPNGTVEAFRMYAGFGRISRPYLVRRRPNMFAMHTYLEWRRLDG